MIYYRYIDILIRMDHRSISFPQICFCLTIICAFMGTLVLSVPVGPIHLFPYRFLLIFMWSLFVARIFINNGRLRLSHIKVKIYLKFLILWLIYSFISTLWAADRIEALRNSIFLFTGVSIVFLIVYYFLDVNHLKLLYWVWVLIFMALIPVGVWEVTTGNHLSISGRYLDDLLTTKFAPTSVFHNQNDYGTHIALTLPLVLVWIRYYPKFYSRALGMLVFFTGLLLLILTYSRACYIAVIVGLAFWFIFLIDWKGKVKTFFITLSIFLLIFLIFSSQTMDILQKIESRLASLSITGFQETGSSLAVRLNLLRNALYFTIKSAGFGVGAGNVEYYMANYKIYPVFGVTNVHNWWVEILSNYGLFIFVGYSILYLSIILNLWRVYKKLSDRVERMLCEGLLVGWVSFFIASGASSSIIAFEPQWIFMGLTVAFLNYCRIRKYEKISSWVF